jgi:hypothetical protein
VRWLTLKVHEVIVMEEAHGNGLKCTSTCREDDDEKQPLQFTLTLSTVLPAS